VSERIERIKQAVEQTEHCSAKHVESRPVIEKDASGDTVWAGVVETFDLEGHPRAKRAFAWVRGQGSGERKDDQYTIALAIPPVISPETAVKAAIVAAFRQL
jgi:hypothetical protein